MPQITNPRPKESGQFAEGLYHVLIGLFKKVVIADNMATIVNTVFTTSTSELSGSECLVGVYAFAFQIYGDFSGYSSIAQGLARWMGFSLMTNFRMPYFAVSPSDFWRRWHISLSQWLRDYLYIYLGGSRHGRWMTYWNLLLTMVLGGLWHGAGWTFLAWELFHGLLLCGYRLIDAVRAVPDVNSAPPSAGG
jgi:alginate O-acetyltransferase complex protein AlgI